MIAPNQVDRAGSKRSQGVSRARHTARAGYGTQGNNSNEMGVHHGIG